MYSLSRRCSFLVLMKQPFPRPLCRLESQVAGYQGVHVDLQRLRDSSNDIVSLAGPPALVEPGLLLRSMAATIGAGVADRYQVLLTRQ